MSYNGSGTFVVNSSGQPVVTGTVISSTAFNALTADLATGLSTAITKDGQTTTTSRILFAQGISSTLTTDATSATTGSIITAGGISTQKALWVGTTSRLVGNVQADGLLGVGMAPVNIVDITQTQDAASFVKFKNISTGVSASASFVLSNSATTSYMSFFGTGVTAVGLNRPDGLSINSGGAGGLTLQTAGAQNIYFGSSQIETMRLTSAGLLGIGGTPTTQALNIFGTSTSTTSTNPAGIRFFDNGFSTAAHIVIRNVALQYNVPTGGAHAFVINDSEVARFSSAGNLLLGATAAVDVNEEKLLVKYTAPKTGATWVCSSTAGNYAIVFNNPNGQVGNILTSGSATSYNTSSDYRLKENVQPMTGGLATISALKPVNYDWIIDKTAGEGFIAHELQAVIPAAVTGEKDAVNEDGSIKPQGVDFSKIVPHLVVAIQELTTRLAALENK